MGCGANKLEDVQWSIGVRGQRIAQIRIEIGQPRTVDNKIKILLQARRDFRAQPQSGLCDVTFNNLDFAVQKVGEPATVAFEQRVDAGKIDQRIDQQTLPMNPVTPISITCRPAKARRTENPCFCRVSSK